jgi:NADH-quinone oxidoreductase subunit E
MQMSQTTQNRLPAAGHDRVPIQERLKFSDKGIDELDALKPHYPNLKACILPALWIAQREFGGTLPPEAIEEVAYRLRRSFSEVEGVATFYSMYNTGHAVGRHMIEVCTCLSCQVNGGYRILDYLKDKLGIGLGETTPDGLFTLHEAECLNACDRAPVVQVGDSYHGPVDPAYLDKLLDELKASDGSTVTALADAVVQVQLAPAPQRKG